MQKQAKENSQRLFDYTEWVVYYGYELYYQLVELFVVHGPL